MSGLEINLDIGFTLDILTCHHMEEEKVPNSMAGSQDALLPIPIGIQANQTIPLTLKIMQQLILLLVEAHGLTGLLNTIFSAAVSTPQL